MTLAGLVNQAYPSPEWAVFFEVSNTTGFGASRRADAIALGIWPSRGNTIAGFEFKEDRRDWLRERDNPAKAEAIAAKCDCWWVVAGKEGIVKVEELPEPWGLYVANADRTKLKVVKPCVHYPDRDKTIMQRSFAAAMLRKVSETTVPRVELARLIEEGVKGAIDRTNDGLRIKSLEDQIAAYQKQFHAFKQITGVDLQHGWQGTETIAKAVNAVLNVEHSRDQLVRTKRLLEQAAKEVGAAVDQWPIDAAKALA